MKINESAEIPNFESQLDEILPMRYAEENLGLARTEILACHNAALAAARTEARREQRIHDIESMRKIIHPHHDCEVCELRHRNYDTEMAELTALEEGENRLQQLTKEPK